jgi:DNA-binding transcriptional LysR family regulator
MPTLAAHVIAPCIAELRASGPVAVDLEFAVPRDLLHEADERELDLLVATFAQAPSAARQVSLGDVRPTLVVSEASPLATRRSVTAAQLGDVWWVAAPAVDDPLFSRIPKYLRRHGLEERIAVRVPHIQTQLALVRASPDLAAIVPLHAAAADGVRALRLTDFGWDARVWAIKRRPSRLVDQLVSLLAARMRRGS